MSTLFFLCVPFHRFLTVVPFHWFYCGWIDGALLSRVASKTSPWQMAIRAPLFSGSGMDKPAILFSFCLCEHVHTDL
ncbi:hypothetical protein HDV63DRAFT_388461 [Trichoderma sp. SZMC 28014]